MELSSSFDYIFKDGMFVGRFDELYANHADPWHQSSLESSSSAHREMTKVWADRLRSEFNCTRILDFGCGFGNMASDLCARGFAVTGIDSVAEAVAEAKRRVPEATFLVGDSLSENLLSDIDPDIIVLSEVTWYVLDQLDAMKRALLDFADKSPQPKFLIHLLEIYPKGEQTYGTEYFTNVDSILKWWGLPWIEAGKVFTRIGPERLERRSTYFVAQLLRA